MGAALGPRRDAKAIIVTLLHGSAASLTAAQIAARTGLSSQIVRRYLLDLDRGGRVGRIAGKPQRWYWRKALDTAA